MDWSSEKYPWLSLLLALALVFAWGVMSLAEAYYRRLDKVNDSFIRGFMIVDQLGVIVDTLARLSVDQEAFLSTGDQRFQDGVVESAESFALNRYRLNSLAAGSQLQSSLNSLSRSIDQILGSVAESDDIMEVQGKVAALVFFESREPAISKAKLQAEQLKNEITVGVSDRIRNARAVSALFKEFLYVAPSGSGLVQKQLLLAVKHERRIPAFRP
jgi:hypothetical protein